MGTCNRGSRSFLPALCLAAFLASGLGCAGDARGPATTDRTQFGSFEIRAPAFDSEIRIRTSALFAGAISSLVFRGKEHIDTLDNGRELQSASSFDDLGECFNPTEAGGAYDKGRKTSSALLSGRASGVVLETTTDMAFWRLPGDDYRVKRPYCGNRPDVTHARNTTILSGHLLHKRVQIGYRGISNVIDYQITFDVPERFEKGVFEALTGYMPRDFTSFWGYDLVQDRLIPLDGKGEQRYPVILATPDQRYAMGVYSPNLPQGGLGYGRFSFPGIVNKWNCVFREKPVEPGSYRYRCLVVVGSTEEVRSGIRQLDALFAQERGPSGAPSKASP